MSNSKTKGFTLIELLVSITILAIISAIGFAAYTQTQVIARDGKRKADLRSIGTALELFYQTNKHYPCSGAGWETSRSTSPLWLSDYQSGCSGVVTDPNIPLAPNYINTMPTDPKLDATYSTSNLDYPKLGYAYFSANQDWGAAPYVCTKGTYYILVATLENTADKDRAAANDRLVCGVSITNFGANSYVITP